MSQIPRAILVDVIPSFMDPDTAKRRLYELECLTNTYGGMVLVKIFQKRAKPDYKTFVGPGKIEEITQLAIAEKVDLLIINNLLKPHQLFNIERMVERSGIKVWDRIDLILKIFQKHAQTTEAKLQIRLAGIRHMGPRIYRMGMELSQQAGGIGTRGIGETNIEIMKRHLAEEERSIKKQLQKYANTRGLHRARRERLGMKTASIVGYTNAGKSSLLNALTRKGAYVADELFATLDTRVAKLWLPEAESQILLSDTIGFIQDLPPQLIQAFRSTLEETIEADLIIHVIDVSDPYLNEKIEEVEGVLKELNVQETPKLYVFNKTDLVKRIPRAALKKQYKEFKLVFISCHKREGLNELKAAIAAKLSA